MSAGNVATSRLSGDRDKRDLYEAAASMIDSRYTQVARSKPSVYATDSQTRTSLELGSILTLRKQQQGIGLPNV